MNKEEGVLVWNLAKNPCEVPRSYFVSMASKIFSLEEVSSLKQHIISCHFLLIPKRFDKHSCPFYMGVIHDDKFLLKNSLIWKYDSH